jgi:hypothetical protein
MMGILIEAGGSGPLAGGYHEMELKKEKAPRIARGF